MLRTRLLARSAMLASAIIVLLGMSGVASAHQYRTNNGVRVVMHIQPEDDPQAKVAAQIVFDLSNGSPVPLSDCNCTATIGLAGKTIATKTVVPSGADGTIVATFPEGGSYTLSLKGTSKSGQFGAFAVTYPVEVAAATASSHSASLVVIAGGALGVIVILLAVTLRRRMATKRPRRRG